MFCNNLELLGNIEKKAPWLIDDNEIYAPATINENARQVINDIRNYHLTIMADNGRVYRQYLTIYIENGKINIDKPFKWLDTTKSFHVFFLNKNKKWHFFQIHNAKTGNSTISAKIPDKIYTLLRRRHRRVPAPTGTKVIFKNPSCIIDIMHVKNISEGGMLICDNSRVNKYPLDSTINEIFLTIPPDKKSGATNTSHRVLPFITQGRVIRSYLDKETSISHYAISFQHENINFSKRFNQVINDFENCLREAHV